MMTAKELFNAKNNGVKIEDGLTIHVVGTGTFNDTDKDGNAVVVSCLKAEDGSIYTSISRTIADSLDMLQEIIDSEGAQDVIVHKNVSANGREFYQLSIA